MHTRIGHPVSTSLSTIITMSLCIPTIIGVCARTILL